MKTSLYLLALIMLLATTAHAEVTYTLDEDYGKVPVTFVPNVGQFESSIKFAIEGNGQGMFTESSLASGTTFVLDASFVSPGETYSGFFLHFVEANGNPAITGEDRVSWNSNYFIGNDPENWHTDIPNYRSIRLHDLYEGIDLVYTSDARRLVFNLVVHPGHAPTQVGFIHPHELGDATITETGDGGLIVEHKGYPAKTYYPPRCYQVIGGQEVDVEISYRFSGLFVYFEFGEYDEAQDLIIELDRVYSTKFAFRNTLGSIGIEVDNTGNVYVAGGTSFIVLDGDHPGSGGAGGFGTIFGLKLNEAGDELEYMTYFEGIGGGYFRSITDLAVDNIGNLCISGWTQKEDFPLTENAPDLKKNESNEGYITILSQAGNSLVFSSYWGGSDTDYIWGIDIYEGKLYITGKTYSKDYVLTNNAIDSSYDDWNGFLSILNYETGDILYSSYFYKTSPHKIFVNNSGIYISGHATTNDHPTTENAFISDYQGGLSDVFVTKLFPDASEIEYSTLIGGSGEDVISDLFVDDNGNAIVAGSTDSSDFPITTTFIDSPVQDQKTSFFTELKNEGTDIEYSNIFGFNDKNNAVGIEFKTDGQSIIAGNFFEGSYVADINSSGTVLTHLLNLDEEIIDFKIYRDNEMILLKSGDNDATQFPIKYNIDSNGTYITKQDEQINSFEIHPPYPNPFNSTTTISFTLLKNSNAIVRIYNINGQLVEKLYSGYLAAGNHVIRWEANNVASGLYYCQIESNNMNKTSKIMLLR